ncbi:MAG: LuxR C-terminal-related transcriptional regulator [Ilumatobacteraceae bacterium]|nr:LuxR C-terminal-related transcriptional regulator [Ilumatobacteraceae bacterium]
MAGVEGTSVSSSEARFAPPRSASGLALRSQVLERLSDPTVRVAVITAPAGYGKTSHAAAFAGSDPRPVAWIDVEPQLDDAPTLLVELVDALASVTDFDPTGFPAAGTPSVEYSTTVSIELGRAVRRCRVPFLLVIDDVHRLTDHAATDLITALIANVPEGSMMVLVGRSCRLDVIARLRVESTVVELGSGDLALDADGVALVLAGMGVDASAEYAEQLVAATEGWPVGVRLAGLASLADEHHVLEPPGVSGHEASILDYVSSEWLWGLSDDEREFLLQVSVLDRLSGPLCDAVLGRHDAGDVLHRLWSERLLVIPLDRRESAYRMHGLLQDVLVAQLERADSDALRQVHRRASEWFEAEGDADRAIRHALAAHDLERAERLVVEHTPTAYTNGLYATIQRWIEAFPRDRLLGSPALCLSAALAALGLGDASALSVWLRLGEDAAGPDPDPDSMAWLCLLELRATMSTGPVRPALADAAAAYRGLPPGIWHAAACLAYGAWSWTAGDPDAKRILAEGVEEARVLGAPAMEAYCSAMLGIIAHAEGDLAGATACASRARRVAADHGLERAPGMAVVSALCSLTAAAGGDSLGASADWQLARAQLALLKDLSGWANVQIRVTLAHASLLLGDRIGAETVLREARDFLARQPDATTAIGQVDKLDELVRHLRRHTAIGSSALTTAELRVLHYLPTNLSLAEIGTRLFVSRYTVKTHCESIYRKLNVGSRSEAVDAARNVGLLSTA